MKEVKITCDNCGQDITYTGSMPKYRIHLHSEEVPHNTNSINMISVYPEIGDEYFCDMTCLMSKYRSQYWNTITN